MRVNGLDLDYSIACLDSNLRRLDIDTEVLSQEDKGTFARRLGGHPVALSIAADAVMVQSAKQVLESIKNRKGNFASFFQRLVNKLRLNDSEHKALRLLTLAREFIPREVIGKVLASASGNTIKSLILLGAVELNRWGGISIAGILRDYFDGSDLSDAVKMNFHRTSAEFLAANYENGNKDLSIAVESEYHARMAGIQPPIETGLVDSYLGTARKLYEEQKYEEAHAILSTLRKKSQTTDILRLSALVDARCNKFDQSLKFVNQVFTRNRNEVRLLVDIVNIALSQSQVHIAEDLVETAKRAHVEDVSILIVEGRMKLSSRDLQGAERSFERAKQLTTRNPWPFYYLGRILVNTGRIDEAIDVLFEGENFIFDIDLKTGSALNAIQTQLGLAYLFADRIDLAARYIDRLFEDDSNNPQVIRAYAALTIKRDGIDEAHIALRRLKKAKISNRFDRCQFHLLYGLFYLGINDVDSASAEFKQAHNADRQNVYVMIKWARTLFNQASELWMEGNEQYKDYANDAARLTRKILEFDDDNEEGLKLMEDLFRRYNISI